MDEKIHYEKGGTEKLAGGRQSIGILLERVEARTDLGVNREDSLAYRANYSVRGRE